MNSDNKVLSASEFPVALFCLGLPLLIAAYAMNGSVAPKNLADILITGLAVLGLLSEPFRRTERTAVSFWLRAGLPCIIIFWVLSAYISPKLIVLAQSLPFLMELRPILYGLVAFLWITIFPPQRPRHFYFWASWLAVFVIGDFCYQIIRYGLTAAPVMFGNAALTGPILLVGLSATLNDISRHKITRNIILAGILCTLSRDASFAAVMILIFFGPKGAAKKSALVVALLLFNYISLASQEMSFFSQADLPTYWLWFSLLELFAKNTDLLLTGFPLAVPLPLSVPVSLWNIWHAQNFAWTDHGIYLFHIAPLWLHILGAWGLGGLAASATIGTMLIRRFSSAMISALLTVVVIAGLFFPLFYSPASGIVLIMAFITATQPEIQSFHFE